MRCSLLSSEAAFYMNQSDVTMKKNKLKFRQVNGPISKFWFRWRSSAPGSPPKLQTSNMRWVTSCLSLSHRLSLPLSVETGSWRPGPPSWASWWWCHWTWGWAKRTPPSTAVMSQRCWPQFTTKRVTKWSVSFQNVKMCLDVGKLMWKRSVDVLKPRWL